MQLIGCLKLFTNIETIYFARLRTLQSKEILKCLINSLDKTSVGAYLPQGDKYNELMKAHVLEYFTYRRWYGSNLFYA